MVNITTPSAAGVSRNRYSQFDVGREGVILNNARGQVQTQLGGWVQGNPWLATGSARVILNEVNGPASRLNGYVEVAGQRAEVIIANPAGIQVNGGGFLNASRVTLTTGTPMFTGAGALEGYRVTGGAIQIDGEGLDTSRADYTDLITRSLKVNAGIWANQLQATLGNNVVNADHSQASLIPANGEAPTFALDVGALGGMFANKIWLVGNAHGVGVRNAGSIGAQAGELVVTVDGRLKTPAHCSRCRTCACRRAVILQMPAPSPPRARLRSPPAARWTTAAASSTHSACRSRRRACATMAAPLNRLVCRRWRSRPKRPATAATVCWVRWMPSRPVATAVAQGRHVAGQRRRNAGNRCPGYRRRLDRHADLASGTDGRGPDRHRRHAGQ